MDQKTLQELIQQATAQAGAAQDTFGATDDITMMAFQSMQEALQNNNKYIDQTMATIDREMAVMDEASRKKQNALDTFAPAAAIMAIFGDEDYNIAYQNEAIRGSATRASNALQRLNIAETAKAGVIAGGELAVRQAVAAQSNALGKFQLTKEQIGLHLQQKAELRQDARDAIDGASVEQLQTWLQNPKAMPSMFYGRQGMLETELTQRLQSDATLRINQANVAAIQRDRAIATTSTETLREIASGNRQDNTISAQEANEIISNRRERAIQLTRLENAVLNEDMETVNNVMDNLVKLNTSVELEVALQDAENNNGITNMFGVPLSAKHVSYMLSKRRAEEAKQFAQASEVQALQTEIVTADISATVLADNLTKENILDQDAQIRLQGLNVQYDGLEKRLTQATSPEAIAATLTQMQANTKARNEAVQAALTTHLEGLPESARSVTRQHLTNPMGRIAPGADAVEYLAKDVISSPIDDPTTLNGLLTNMFSEEVLRQRESVYSPTININDIGGNSGNNTFPAGAPKPNSAVIVQRTIDRMSYTTERMDPTTGKPIEQTYTGKEAVTQVALDNINDKATAMALSLAASGQISGLKTEAARLHAQALRAITDSSGNLSPRFYGPNNRIRVQKITEELTLLSAQLQKEGKLDANTNLAVVLAQEIAEQGKGFVANIRPADARQAAVLAHTIGNNFAPTWSNASNSFVAGVRATGNAVLAEQAQEEQQLQAVMNVVTGNTTSAPPAGNPRGAVNQGSSLTAGRLSQTFLDQFQRENPNNMSRSSSTIMQQYEQFLRLNEPNP